MRERGVRDDQGKKEESIWPFRTRDEVVKYINEEKKDARTLTLGFSITGAILGLVGGVYYIFLAFLTLYEPEDFFVMKIMSDIVDDMTLASVLILVGFGMFVGSVSLIIYGSILAFFSGFTALVGLLFWISLLVRLAIFTWRVLFLALVPCAFVVVIILLQHIIGEVDKDLNLLKRTLRDIYDDDKHKAD